MISGPVSVAVFRHSFSALGVFVLGLGRHVHLRPLVSLPSGEVIWLAASRGFGVHAGAGDFRAFRYSITLKALVCNVYCPHNSGHRG